MSVTITVEKWRLDSRINAIQGGLEKAIKRASARASTHGKKEISDVIRQRVVIKAGTVKEQIGSKQVGKTGQQIKLSKTKRFSLREFGAKQNAKGVSYRIAKTGKRGFVRSAFILEKLGGSVYRRHGAKRKMTKGSYKGKMRQPIIKLLAVSAWGSFTGGDKERTVADATHKVGASISEMFHKRLQHEVNYIISQAK